jgi:hypothetical protein
MIMGALAGNRDAHLSFRTTAKQLAAGEVCSRGFDTLINRRMDRDFGHRSLSFLSGQ